MTTKVSLTPYDEVPYPSLSYNQSHPDRLATVATLLGMSPAPVTQCRVLEIGCASGGNLIPMAYSLPESEFVGIDYAATQIAEGQEAVQALELKNITLKHFNILDVLPDFGQFDYIIAHGIYSWVPPIVQDKLLAICRQNLAPNGVAYVSYNTYPGWYMMGMMRDMMLYHTRQTGLQKRAVEARAFIDFLAQAVPADSSGYGSFIHGYLDLLTGNESGHPRADSALLHDELEEVNDPIYFYQFIERAANHGLQYLGEAEFRSMLPDNFPPQVTEALRKLVKSLVDMEQYMDFLKNRSFRQTLLCRQEVSLSRTMTPEHLSRFSVASQARPESENPELHTVSVEKFRATDGAVLSIDHPVSKAAMLYLAEVWPQAVPFKTLLEKARARLGSEGVAEQRIDAQVLGANLVKAYSYSGNLMEFHIYMPALMLEVSERPIASPVANFQAQSNPVVTNLRHERVSLDEFDRFLLIHLDGSHTQNDLLEALLAGPVAAGVLTLKQTEPASDDPEQIKSLLAQEVQRKLTWLARAALLVG